MRTYTREYEYANKPRNSRHLFCIEQALGETVKKTSNLIAKSVKKTLNIKKLIKAKAREEGVINPQEVYKKNLNQIMEEDEEATNPQELEEATNPQEVDEKNLNKKNEQYILSIREGSKEDVEEMIKNGADKDYKSQEGTPPLIIAFEKRYLGDGSICLDTVKYLIDIGVDVNARDKSYKTILMHILESIVNIEILLFDSGEITEGRIINLVNIFEDIAAKSIISDFQKECFLKLALDIKNHCDDESLALRYGIFDKIIAAANINIDVEESIDIEESIDVEKIIKKVLIVGKTSLVKKTIIKKEPILKEVLVAPTIIDFPSCNEHDVIQKLGEVSCFQQEDTNA